MQPFLLYRVSLCIEAGRFYGEEVGKMKKFVLAGLAAAVVASASIAFAQPYAGQGGYCREGGRGPGAGRMYDSSKETTLTGTVASVEQITARGRMQQGQGVVLNLKTGEETVFVHLGPQWYLDKQAGMKIAAGDTIEIKGAKTVRRGEEVILAAEVKKGSEVLKLRDENGYPVWAGWKRGQTQ
jgi:hypothetical protein